MGGDSGESIGALVARLIESAKIYVRAEITLVKRTVLGWIGRAKPALVFLVVALVLVLSSVTIALAALGMALAHWLGIPGGLAVAALIGLGIAGTLAALAVRRLNGMNE